MIRLIHHELHRLARNYMNRERAGHSRKRPRWSMRLTSAWWPIKRMQWQDRAHFFAVSAQLMRRFLVERARRHNLKRDGGIQHINLERVSKPFPTSLR